VKIPHAKSVYELTKDNHAHLICEECAEVNDISLDLNPVIENAIKKSNFGIDKSELFLSGICKSCQ